MDHTPAPVRKYVLLFTGAYAAILVVIAAILQFTDANSSSTGFVALFVAVAFAGSQFAKDRYRAPSTQERVRFAIGSTLISIAVSIVLTGIGLLLLASQQEVTALTELLSLSPILMVFLFLFVTAINFAVTYFAFRWFANMTLKNIERKKAVAGKS